MKTRRARAHPHRAPRCGGRHGRERGAPARRMRAHRASANLRVLCSALTRLIPAPSVALRPPLLVIPLAGGGHCHPDGGEGRRRRVGRRLRADAVQAQVRRGRRWQGCEFLQGQRVRLDVQSAAAAAAARVLARWLCCCCCCCSHLLHVSAPCLCCQVAKTPKGAKPPSISKLQTASVFLLDTGFEVYLWVGDGAGPSAKSSAFIAGQHYLKK